jgi:hypothetical protein
MNLAGGVWYFLAWMAKRELSFASVNLSGFLPAGLPMALQQRKPCATGPNGESVSLADLPDANTNNWGMLRKARVVAAVEGGLIALSDACQRYNM